MSFQGGMPVRLHSSCRLDRTRSLQAIGGKEHVNGAPHGGLNFRLSRRLRFDTVQPFGHQLGVDQGDELLRHDPRITRFRRRRDWNTGASAR